MSDVGEAAPGAATEEVDFGMLKRLLGFNMRMAQNAMYRHFSACLETLELRQREFAVLELIESNTGISQVRLAAALSVDRPAMMVVVDRLQARKLLVRRPSERDRRRQELYLTAKGADLLTRAKAAVAAHDRAFTGLFSPAEAEGLLTQLRRIAAVRP
jgi:MarR family transcriptional regulator, organic hydroperoxide resistance regulator